MYMCIRNHSEIPLAHVPLCVFLTSPTDGAEDFQYVLKTLLLNEFMQKQFCCNLSEFIPYI